MESVSIAINGLGRIGRALLRQAAQTEGVRIVALNDHASPKALAHLIKYDSVHGRCPIPVSLEGERLHLGTHEIAFSTASSPETAALGRWGADVVIDCTGAFSTARDLRTHLVGSVKRVLATGTLQDADGHPFPFVQDACRGLSRGVFDMDEPDTHCLILMLRVLQPEFRIRGLMANSVQSYRANQPILDLPHDNLRLARAAASNMIPVPSTMGQTAERLYPWLRGRTATMGIRVPTPDVGLLDLTVSLEEDTSVEAINDAFTRAASGQLEPWLSINEDELVSSDLIGHPKSCAFDPFLTKRVGAKLFKIFGWFDNEWAYAARLLETATLLGRAPAKEPA